MEKGDNLQALMFKAIRQKLSQHISIAQEVSELLAISSDSAYRRLRGSKKLSIEEVKILCKRFNISIDSLFGLSNSHILFEHLAIEEKGDGFEDYLKLLVTEIPKLNSSKSIEVIFAARDLPIFHYFEFPELAAFKIYFWKKMQLRYHDYLDKLFSLENIPMQHIETGRLLLSSFIQIPTIEIWNNETFSRIFQQIEFCLESGFFANKLDAFILCDKLDLLIRHIHHQTEFGCKSLLGQQDYNNNEENYKVYFNEVLIIDNTVFVLMDGVKSIYLTCNSLSLLLTTNQAYCTMVEQSIRTLMKTGVHISGTSALECNRLFNSLYDKVKLLKQKIQYAGLSKPVAGMRAPNL
jgi:hypothetical protein